MGRFTREELREAFDNHNAKTAAMSESGDWSEFADLFTQDVHFLEYNVGVYNGRDALYAFITNAMAGSPHMRFPTEWVAFDEENDAVVAGFRNIWDHPTEPGVEFWFPNVTRLVYAGNGKFSVEEDVYNPAHLGEALEGWLAAGGKLAGGKDDIFADGGSISTEGSVPPGLPILTARQVERIAPNTWNKNL